ncbi:MAG: lipoate---protein ligase, partial [Actinomycetota bacterium]
MVGHSVARARGDGISLTTRLTHWAGTAGALHARPILTEQRVTELYATRPAIVLGRGQKVDDGFEARASAAGLGVARRVSGGSAVLVGPGECAWVDVVVARGADGWNDDIGKAGCWMGDQWVVALEAAGVRDLTVHRTAMERRPGSAAVCFAGVGSGEVLRADGAKLVGVSQRRTREWALFQC